MLDSVKLQKRQSEIRQEMASLSAKSEPSEDELRSMDSLGDEYSSNETRYRAALIAEDTERREAGAELETRSEREYADLVGRFELRQVALALDEGAALEGPTREVVEELRSAGGYQGVPVPWQALERRAGETVASGTPAPIDTRPIIDRLFPASVAARMGASMINIGSGQVEYPVNTSSTTVGWQATETGDVGAPSPFETVDRPLAPDYTLGVQMAITRKTMKQSGAALEAAVRRDMNSAMAQEMDRVAFLGEGSGSAQPLGVIEGASTYGITETAVGAPASWQAFRARITQFMVANAISSPSDVRLLIRPEIYDSMDDTLLTGTAVSEFDRLARHIGEGNVAMSSNALAAPAGGESSALLTTSTNGVPPMFVATWGAVDMIRDPFTRAASGQLVLTALATMDVTIARPVQLEVLTGLQ